MRMRLWQLLTFLLLGSCFALTGQVQVNSTFTAESYVNDILLERALKRAIFSSLEAPFKLVKS